MLLPWLVRSEMKIKDLCPLEKTEKTAQSCGFLRFSLLTFCASLYTSRLCRRLIRDSIHNRSDYGYSVSGNGDLAGECHDAEPEQERGKNEETDPTQNRPSRPVFRNAVGLSGIIISDHLPSQLPPAGQRLTA